jgi:hypothetical protein
MIGDEPGSIWKFPPTTEGSEPHDKVSPRPGPNGVRV